MAPTVRFHSQPSDDGTNAGEFFRRLLLDPEIESIDVVIAWVKFRGVGRLRDELRAFAERGQSRIILGIDEGGATRPGLIAAMHEFSEAYVYHVRGAGTFHPKVYFGAGQSKAHLFVGSSNLTPGGLFFNDEASLEAVFSLPAETNEPALIDAQAFIARLLADNEVCLRLTNEVIEKLVVDPHYRVSRTERRTKPTIDAPLPEGADADDVDEGAPMSEDSETEPLFGTSQRAKPSMPSLSPEARAELADLEGEEPGASAESTSPAPQAAPPPEPPMPTPASLPVPTAPAGAEKTWRKRLPASDAQHQQGNITGNVRLTQASEFNGPIPFLIYFRYDFFGTEAWRPDRDRNNNVIQVASVPFDVVIVGVSHGTVELDVDHAPHRESEQHNHATVLHWGPLAPLMRETDYTNRILELARLSDGSYRLKIT